MQRTLASLLVVTTAFEGFRAGAGTFRMILDLPARTVIGPAAFAAFSRATDLSTAGVAFYAIYGVGGAVLSIALWIAAMRARMARIDLLLIGLSVLCSLGVLVFTTQAAPLMFAIGAATDEAQLPALIERFVFWTNPRIVLVDLSFVALLAVLWRALTAGPRAL
jgi:hypothetical protein